MTVNTVELRFYKLTPKMPIPFGHIQQVRLGNFFKDCNRKLINKTKAIIFVSWKSGRFQVVFQESSTVIKISSAPNKRPLPITSKFRSLNRDSTQALIPLKG